MDTTHVANAFKVHISTMVTGVAKCMATVLALVIILLFSLLLKQIAFSISNRCVVTLFKSID